MSRVQTADITTMDRRFLTCASSYRPLDLEDIPHPLGEKGAARSWDIHAEVAAIRQAQEKGIDLEGTRMITQPRFPCSSCALEIVQAGIRKVVAPEMIRGSYWYEDQCLALRILCRAGLCVEFTS